MVLVQACVTAFCSVTTTFLFIQGLLTKVGWGALLQRKTILKQPKIFFFLIAWRSAESVLRFHTATSMFSSGFADVISG